MDVKETRTERAEIGESIDRYIQAGKELRKRHGDERNRSLSQTMQEALYDDQGLPVRESSGSTTSCRA